MSEEKMASYWQNLMPLELVTEIFKFLPRHDRYSCYQVCQRWKDALDSKDLWRRMILYIDKDFIEKTTTIITRHYYRHIKILEIGWETPIIQNRWLPLKLQDLTKNMVHYIMKLYEYNVQLNAFKLFDWYEVQPFKKVFYQLARFLKIQTNLKKLTFHNIHLPKTECMKILNACIRSNNVITHLEIHNYLYNINTTFDTKEFLNYLQRLKYLRELKLDYFIFSRDNVIDVISEIGKNYHHINLLEIYFDEADLHSALIPKRKWDTLKNCCPKLHTSFVIRNITYYEQIEFIFLMENIPLNSFSLTANSKFDQKISRNFEITISRLIDNYKQTLEAIYLDIKNNKEDLEKVLLRIILQCHNLRTLYFDGIVNENMALFENICAYNESMKGLHVKILPHKYKSIINIIHLFS